MRCDSVYPILSSFQNQVLEDAVKPDSFEPNGSRRPETILVITDGEPSDKTEVEKVIINATKKYMKRDEDLSITFVQIGNDEGATSWLTGSCSRWLYLFQFGHRYVFVVPSCHVNLSYEIFERALFVFAELDDGLQARGARFDCVDTLTWADAEGTSFDELIRLSIGD